MFPGCRRERWNPLNRPTKGKLAEAIDAFEQLASIGIGQIPYKVIRAHIAMKDVNNFRKHVSTRDEWADACANCGYIQTTLKGGAQGLVMLPEAAFHDG